MLPVKHPGKTHVHGVPVKGSEGISSFVPQAALSGTTTSQPQPALQALWQSYVEPLPLLTAGVDRTHRL